MELFSKSTGKKIGDHLLKNNQRIAVAESVSSGLLQLAFASMENATNFFQGGLTAYNLAQKTKHLSVEPIHAGTVNCVSQKVANEMAMNVTNLFISDWGISLSGYASAVPESGHKMFAYYSISFKGEIIAEGKLVPLKKDMQAVQLEYTNKVLQIFLERLTSMHGKSGSASGSKKTSQTTKIKP